MSSILFIERDGQIVKENVNSEEVGYLLTVGYASTPEQLTKRAEVDTNDSGKLSDTEIKAAAKEAGITIGRKTIKTLTKELGL